VKHFQSSDKRALIIGSGIGGLSMGIILSRLGFSVTVVEKNRQPGGMLRSYKRKGIHCNVGLHYLGALGEGQVLRRLFDYLGITEELPLVPMGNNGPVDRYHIEHAGGGKHRFDMPVGLEAYDAALKESFPSEHTAIGGFMAMLRQSAGELDRLEFLYNNQATANLIDQTEPLWEVLDRLGCSPGLKSVLSVPSLWIGVPPPRCPQFYHTMTLASYLFSAWRLKSHGTHLVEILVKRLTDLGGTLICGHSVSRIRVQEGNVCGLTLDDGAQHDAPMVVGTVHPGVVVNLLEQHEIKPSYRRRINSLENTAGMFSVNAKVPAANHQALDYNVFSMESDAAGTVGDVIYAQLRCSESPNYLHLSLITKGYDTKWKPWENTLSGRRGDAYEAAKTSLAHALIKRIEPVIGKFDDIEVIDTYTPLTIRDWVNSPGGSAYGVMRSDNQMLSAALLNRTAIKGLYLAGQSVMAPGILGAILGSLVTTKFILGPERFGAEVQL
jgi:phytoene dehydrogenase-like protein